MRATLACALLVSSAAAAQDETPTRVPDDGVAILDCAPPAPAPEESCLLRVPPGQLRGALRSRSTGEERGSFDFVRPEDPAFPAGVTLSATILLVDLSPGPGGGRRATFETERELIRRLARGLPRDELVAVYGFNEQLERLSDFTSDRSRTLDAIGALELRGTNTRIGTYARDAIDVLEERDDTLLKNIILVTDGDEEGNAPIAEVNDAAVEAGVTVSAVGMFWRPVGSAQTGRGMDYIERLSEGSRGAAAQAILGLPDVAETAIDEFVADFGSARRNSGLIVPDGEPRAAEIFVTIKEPVIGARGEYVDREISARFEPTSGAAPPPPPEPPKILGMSPPMAYATGGGLLLALVALALFVALRRRGETGDGDEDFAFAGAAGAEEISGSEEPATAAAPAPPPRPDAWLQREDNGERIAVIGKRVSIGRSSANSVVLADESISRVHAELHRNRDGGFSLTDMQSLNGTWVNDEKLSGTQRVSGGDRLRFGNIRARLLLP